ncbi:MAG: hypothetical protein SH819_13380 [Cytophagales bacterium]|nr:hypothetical protein [Cytophagales bacterium]
MKETKIDMKAESLPWQAKFLGVLFVLAAVAVMISYWWLSILLIVAGVTLLTGYSGTEIDVVSKTFREYHSYLFIRSGATEKYNTIDRIFINYSKVTEKMYTAHTLNSSTFRSILYNAYLKFDDGKKIFLTSRKNKAKLIRILEPVAVVLETQLVDTTA